MKQYIHLLVAAVVLASLPVAHGQAKKQEPGASEPAKTEETKAEATRPMPMYSRVDEIDATGKTFTQNTRDGRKVKHVITNKTDIKQGRNSAKFEEIKVGDMVSGSRIKKNTDGTEYEIVKITKFGPKEAKK